MASKNYNVISIVGVQNSGKSTLLNKIFNTKFPVLRDGIFQQTTTGVYIDVSDSIPDRPVVVLDFEGSGSQGKRNEDLYLDHKFGLLGLLVSDCLLVNIQIQNIATNEGAYFSTLNEIMSARLTYFQDIRLKLIFIIHDCVEARYSQNIMERQIREIYFSGICTQNGILLKEIDRYFDIHVFRFSNFHLSRDEYDRDVDQLRTYLFEKVLLPNYSGDIVGSQFLQQCRHYWDDISRNRELDFKSIAYSRMDRRNNIIMEEIIRTIQPEIDEKYREGVYVTHNDFNEWCIEIFRRCTDDFNGRAYGVNDDVLVEYISKLKSELESSVRVVAAAQREIIYQQLLREFKFSFQCVSNEIENIDSRELLKSRLDVWKREGLNKKRNILERFDIDGNRIVKIEGDDIDFGNDNYKQMLEDEMQSILTNIDLVASRWHAILLSKVNRMAEERLVNEL